MTFQLLRPGIRRKLFGLAVTLALPFAIVAAARAVERWRSEQALLSERGLVTAKRAAQLLDDDIQRVQTMLVSMTRLLDLNASVAHNDSLIRSLLATSSTGISNVWIADTNGVVRGSLIPQALWASNAQLGDRQYFKDALKSRVYMVGQPVRSRIKAGAPFVVPFALAITRPGSDRALGVVGAGMIVDSLSAIALTRDLPAGSVLTVLRGDGRVFLRSVDLEGWVTRTFASSARLATDRTSQDTVGPAQSDDGVERLVAQVKLHAIDGRVYVGVPVSATLEIAQRQFLMDLLLGGLATIVVAWLALSMARRIADPIIDVTDVAHAFARGDRSRRITVSGNDEVAVLARAFNQLAETVQDREQALAESEARYRQLFATNPLPVVTWIVTTGRIDQVNDAARAFLGDARLAPDRARILDLIDRNERDAFADLQLPLDGQIVNAGQWTQTDASGARRRVEIVLGAFERNRQRVAAAVMIDLTQRLRAEEELESSKEQLRQSQKMEALGSFAGGIAHDFNNYLSAISTNAELLRDGLTDSHTEREEAQEILDATQRAATLTRQILVFSRRQVPQEQRLYVNVVIREIEPLLRRLVGEHIAMHVELDDTLRPVLFDRGRLEQVLMNLVANARDAMRRGGDLTITTRHGADESVELVVSDTGDGIPESTRSRIFEPFFTTKERGRGTGLGLAIVDSIVTSAHGRITVESAIGKGARFTISLPAASGEATSVSATAESDTDLSGSEHVLLVEDDDAVRSSTAISLRRAGYEVTIASSGRDALAVLDAGMANKPVLMLTDVVMPGLSGPALAARVRERLPEIRVVYMSGYADDDVLMDGLERQNIHFVAKPFTRAELLGELRRALEVVRNG